MRTTFSQSGLHTAIYDLWTQGLEVIQGDVEFFSRLAEKEKPVLELGCGTGRVALALAEQGLQVDGLDLSEAMLELAREKRAQSSQATQGRLRLFQGDMSDFSLERRYGLIYIAFRSFQALLSRVQQEQCLAAIHRHLLPGGRVAIDLFDPQLDRCFEGTYQEEQLLGEALHPSGDRICVYSESRRNDAIRQVFAERWRFERWRGEQRVATERELLEMRWTYRYEMQGLLEAAGFGELSEFSDFYGAPPAYGREQIWVARRLT